MMMFMVTLDHGRGSTAGPSPERPLLGLKPLIHHPDRRRERVRRLGHPARQSGVPSQNRRRGSCFSFTSTALTIVVVHTASHHPPPRLKSVSSSPQSPRFRGRRLEARGKAFPKGLVHPPHSRVELPAGHRISGQQGIEVKFRSLSSSPPSSSSSSSPSSSSSSSSPLPRRRPEAGGTHLKGWGGMVAPPTGYPAAPDKSVGHRGGGC
jgi:hypothetical protein